MCLNLKIKRRSSFILLEVLISLTITALFFPHFFQDRLVYQKEIQKLFFCNELENEIKRHLFKLYSRLYSDPIYSQIQKLENDSFTIQDIPLHIRGVDYPTQLLIQKELDRQERKNFHIQVSVLIHNLPHSLKMYQTNYQNYYLKKAALSKKSSLER